MTSISTTTEAGEPAGSPPAAPTPAEAPRRYLPSTVAIEVAHVSKRFKKHSERAKTLKERALTFRTNVVDDFLALNDVDFNVRVGETFGILGHNGSGKSTLLKCVAGTIRPSAGVIRVRGRLSALLELGAGFHPDLTGRENIYLNGSILGFSKEHIHGIFDDIVEFSGLSEFIDTQVKHYSSGMYARLGFAVAVNLEPDVLLVDEVLAVGDEAFQRKCIERVRGFQSEGRTICLVTHSPEMVRMLCDRAVVLDHGRMLHVGDVNEAVAIYRRSLGDKPAEPADDGSPAPVPVAKAFPARMTAVWIEPRPDGSERYRPGDKLTIGLRYSCTEETLVRARLLIHSHDGVQMVNASSADISRREITATPPGGEVRFVIDDLPFTDGQYLITLVFGYWDESCEYDRSEQELRFEVYTGEPILSRVALDLSLDERS